MTSLSSVAMSPRQSNVLIEYHKENKRLLERVQKKATKMIPGMEDMKYTDHLREVNLPPLQHRRRRDDMIQVYKIISGMD